MYVFIALAVLLVGTGVLVYKTLTKPVEVAPETLEEVVATLPEVDGSVTVNLEKAAKANTVVLTVSGLASKYATVGYEFSYDSVGLIKGVNSGNKPLDVAGKEEFDREVYLGTCSKNVCTADAGVKSITVTLVFTTTDGEQSQFNKEFAL